MTSFSELLRREGPVLGLYVSSGDPAIIELAKKAGFDFIRIDLEHSLISYADLAHCIRTATLLDLPVHVRVSSLDDVTRLLDFGVTGIVVPGVNTPERARRAVELVKYYPLGARGMLPVARCVGLSGASSFTEYLETANDLVTLAIQIEDVKAADCINEILSLEGIDAVSTGKADISQSAGVPGQLNHPKVIEMENLIVRKALEAGKQPVVMVGGRERLLELQRMGVKVFMAGLDQEMILRAFQGRVRELKGL